MRCLKTKRVCTAPVECTNQGCIVVRNATAPADGPGMLSITANEFAAMARDAERYRWFRNKLRDYDGDVALWEHTKGCDYEIKQGANLDAAIDAAMAERNKETA